MAGNMKLALVLAVLLGSYVGTNVASVRIPQKRSLPSGNLILAYATSCSNDGATALAEAREGVNVIVWFATNLVKNTTTGKAGITYGLNSTCVAFVAKTLRDEGLETAHLISIGGWDAPHPDTFISGSEWFEQWERWNTGEIVSRPKLGWFGFDGFDWDLEGNDNKSSPWNHFTLECMHLVGEMSKAAKRAGYIVTMVPPESYLDPTQSGFDFSLLHAYNDGWQPTFAYHGRNSYAYLISKFGAETFDLIDVQLYETFSHADFSITHKGEDPAKYLTQWVSSIIKGWHVNYSNVDIPAQFVRVDASRLIIGFSFGGKGGRTVFVWPEAVRNAFNALPVKPRGVMYWNMDLDRRGVFNATVKRPGYTFASGFNAFLKTRT